MLNLEVNIKGRCDVDLIMAIDEMKRVIERGLTDSANENETGSYQFTIKGQGGAYAVTTHNEDVVYLTEHELQTVFNECEKKINFNKEFTLEDLKRDSNEPYDCLRQVAFSKVEDDIILEQP